MLKVFPLILFLAIASSSAAQKKRARDFGIPFDGTTGTNNAITDVAGVAVGHTTIINGEGNLQKGKGPVRTGVTAILPHGKEFIPVYASFYALNGNGDMTGTHWITESGFLETPILITNTGNVGTVRDAAWQWMDEHKYYTPIFKDYWFAYPVVAETYDGILNDINGQHVKRDHVFKALDNATQGPVQEGSAGLVAFRDPPLCRRGTKSPQLSRRAGQQAPAVTASAPAGYHVQHLDLADGRQQVAVVQFA